LRKVVTFLGLFRERFMREMLSFRTSRNIKNVTEERAHRRRGVPLRH